MGEIIMLILSIIALVSGVVIFQVIGALFLVLCLFGIGYEIYENVSPKAKAINQEIENSYKRKRQELISAIRQKNKKRKDDIADFKAKYGSITNQVLFTVDYDGLLLVRAENLGIVADDNIATDDKVTYDEIWNYPERPFLVFEEVSILVIDNNAYRFSDILGYKLTDNEKFVVSESQSETKTDTGSMVGRALIGGLALGGVGAIIGGATAKSKTTTSEYETSKSHNYVISVFVNSLSSSLIQMKLYSDIDKVQKIISILSVIVHRNNHPTV